MKCIRCLFVLIATLSLLVSACENPTKGIHQQNCVDSLMEVALKRGAMNPDTLLLVANAIYAKPVAFRMNMV
jgi:hypothetical protein